MDVVAGPLLRLILTVIDLYMWVVIIAVILSWLVSFRVVNPGNRFVYMIGEFCHRATEPALRPLRRILPNLGGFDISPVILILLLYFLKDVLIRLFTKFAV